MPKHRIVLGECEPVLAELPSKGVAIITDPPYGINLKTDFGKRGGANPIGATKQAKVVGDNTPFSPAHLLRFETALLHKWIVADVEIGYS